MKKFLLAFLFLGAAVAGYCANPKVDNTITNVAANEDDGNKVINLTTIFSDPDGDALTVTVSGNTNNTLLGTSVVYDATTKELTLSYKPDQNGVATITLKADDGTGTVETSFDVTVNAVNDAPSFNKGANQTVTENAGTQSVSSWATNISAGGGSDENSQTLSFVVTNDDNSLFSAQPVIDANGNLSYTLANNATGTAHVDVKIMDNGGTDNGGMDESAVQSFTISINAATNNSPTVANPITDVAVNEDANNSVINLSGTFSDPESDPLTISVQDNSNTGLLDASYNASTKELTLAYNPDKNGTANITIRATDPSNAIVEDVFKVTVRSVNDAPSFTAGPNQTKNENSGAQSVSNWASNISAGPSNESTQTLSFVVTNDNNALFSAQPDVDATGKLIYTLAANTSGVATVSVKLTDDGGTTNGGVDESPVQTFTITINAVNQTPTVAAPNPDITANEDAVNKVIDLSGTFSDPDGDAMTITVDNSSAGLLGASYDPSTKKLTLAYNPDKFGTATITVRATDPGDAFVEDAFDVTVRSVNDAPSFTAGTDQTVDEDAGAQTITNWASNISAGPSNESTQTLSFVVTNNNNALFSVQPTIDANGNLTYKPKANANGVATVSVTLTDDGGTANGGVDQSTLKTFTITINPVNDAPVVANPIADVIVDEDAASTVLDLSSTFSDEDGDVVSISVTSSNTGLLTATYSSSTKKLTLSYGANKSGTATITVKANDGNGGTVQSQFTVTVNAVNDAPVIVTPISNVTVNEDAANTVIDLSGTFSDPENDPLTITVDNSNTGLLSATYDAATKKLTLNYGANKNSSTPATITVTADDGNGGSTQTQFTVTVNPVNDAPSFTKGADQTVNESAPAQTVTGWATNISAGPSDENSQTLNFIVTNNNNSLFSAQPAIDATGKLTYTPAANASGVATVSVSLKDNGGTANGGTDQSAVQTFTITVNAVNDPPTFTLIGNQTVLEDAGAQTLTNAITNKSAGPNETNQAITLSVSNDNNSMFSAQPAINITTGTLTYTPASDANGTATVTVALKDDGGTPSDPSDDQTTTKTFDITITSVNDAPSFTVKGDQTVTEDPGLQTVASFLTAKSAGPSNESGQTLTLTVSNNNTSLFTTGGQPAIDASGNLTYTPALDANGTATVTVTLTDNGGTANGGVNVTSKTFTITVTPVLDAADRKVLLNEVYSNPGTGKNEFFELYNTSTDPTPVQLDCYTLAVYYRTSSSTRGFYVIDLPRSTIDPKKWYVGASASTINVQSQTGVSANFSWANIPATGSIKKYQYNNKGGAAAGYDLVAISDYNDIFQPVQSGGDVAVFLFNQGFYVNGFIAGFNTGTTVPSQITGLPPLPLTFANTSACGSGFTIDWSTVTTAEYQTGGGAGGSDNGFARNWDGNCGSWVKTSNSPNHTPGRSNIQQGSVQTSILTTSQNIICGTRLEFSVSSLDANVFPVDVRIYNDVNKNGLLDVGDVLFSDPITITSSSNTIYPVTGLDPSLSYIVVYNTALGCSDAITTATATPSLTTAQYNYCSKQLGASITAANQVALSNAFPVTVKFLNNGTQIGSSITINAPGSTIYYSDALTTAFDPTKVSIQYVPSSSSCLKTITVSNASSSSFVQASGTLLTTEQLVSTVPGSTYPGQVQARVTGITSTTGFIEANTVPVKASLYYENDPSKTTDDVLIESYTFNAFSSTYHMFDHVFTYEKDNGKELKVVYTPQLSCPAISKSIGAFLSPLPVTFKSFTAVRKDESKVALTWTTASEQNNRGFHVQRNTGSGWQDIAFVFSAAEGGTSTSELSYSYTDVNLTKGMTQYRILQVDLNGSGHYSETRSVNGSAASGKLLVFPNPSYTGSVMLVFDSDGARNVVVSDASGRVVQQYKAIAGSSLEIKNLANGFYIVQVKEIETGVISIEKFIIKKR